MVTLMVVVWLSAPEVPFMVTVAVPRDEVLLAFRVSVLEVVVGLGVKEVVMPFGRPEADMVTEPENLLSGATVTVVAPCLDRAMVRVVAKGTSRGPAWRQFRAIKEAS